MNTRGEKAAAPSPGRAGVGTPAASLRNLNPKVERIISRRYLGNRFGARSMGGAAPGHPFTLGVGCRGAQHQHRPLLPHSDPLPGREVSQHGPSRAPSLGPPALGLLRAEARTPRGPGSCYGTEPERAPPGHGSKTQAFGGVCSIPASSPPPRQPPCPCTPRPGSPGMAAESRGEGCQAQAFSLGESEPE